jgi:flagellar hook-associated protein 1 FlgK
VGTGVQISSIRRLRNDFVDMNYRNVTSESSYYSVKDQVFSILESSINEIKDSGLQKALSNFFDAWHEGSVSPEDPTVRRIIVEQSQNLIDAFKYVQNQLVSTRSDVDFQIVNSVARINDIGKEIAKLNEQISLSTSQGQQPNDLLDQRDTLLDELSQYVNIQKVDLPTGSVSVFIGGLSFVDDRTVNEIKAIDNDRLIDNGEGYEYTEGLATYSVLPGLIQNDKWNESITLGTEDIYNGHVSTLWLTMGNSLVPLDDRHLAGGKLKGLVEIRDDVIAYGGEPGRGLLEKINEMAYYFFDKVNLMLKQGKDINGDAYNSNFFNWDVSVVSENIISAVALDPAVVSDPTKLPLGVTGLPGDGSLALLIAQEQNNALETVPEILNSTLWNPSLPGFLKGQSVAQSWRTLVAEWSSDISRNRAFMEGTNNVKSELTLLRTSESGVNLDEEAVNLIRFQKGYAMSARIVSVVDGMLDLIINMGAR